jgi:peptidoglycan/LPS O-acetylase OafA/YrhL
LVFGWFYILPTDYRDLGQQIEKSSLFTSNLLFAKGGGYFDTAEHTKWLLHTWSLSVEWQFYIFFPIIIITLKKYLSFTNLKRVVIGLFLTSFIYCIYATYEDSKTAYFLLTSRAWEMLLGGLAFLYPWSLKNKYLKIITQCFGLILIIASYFLISKDTPWPGYMALIPVFGSYFIISSNYQNNILISNPIFSYIGKWSYSIYVWHWTLVVF